MENVFESTEDYYPDFSFAIFPNYLVKQCGDANSHTTAHRPLSLLYRPILLGNGNSISGQHFCYTQYRYFSKGVCTSPRPDIPSHFRAAGSAVDSVGKSTGRRQWVKRLQRGSQKDYRLQPERSALEQHVHLPSATSHIFREGTVYPGRQQKGTSWGTSANMFHLCNFCNWYLLSVLHNHLFSPV